MTNKNWREKKKTEISHQIKKEAKNINAVWRRHFSTHSQAFSFDYFFFANEFDFPSWMLDQDAYWKCDGACAGNCEAMTLTIWCILQLCERKQFTEGI